MQLIKQFTILLFFLAFSHNAFASDTYETQPPIQQQIVDFTGNSASDGSQRYVQRIRLPLGTTFDRIQLASDYPQALYAIMVTDGIDGTFESCSDSACVQTDVFAPQPLTIISSGALSTSTRQYIFNTSTTITTTNQYLLIVYDPNPSYSFFQNVVFDDVIWSETGFNQNRTNSGVAFRVCNGACDSTSFNDIPNLTATPWARMVTPTSGTIQPYTTDFEFQINWGTNTNRAEIRFLSNYQSIAPITVNPNISGLQIHTFTKAFPAIDDNIQIVIELFQNNASRYISPTYTLNLRDISQLESDLQNTDISSSACDNIVVGALCSIASFLFIPSETPTQTFTNVLDNIDSKKPFSYFSQTASVIQSVASTTPSSEFVNLEVTINLPPVSGTYPILTKQTLDAIYDENTRLMVRSIIGYGLWIIFALTVLYMLLNIFNRAVYLGEQGNEKQSFSNRSKTVHER